MSRGHEGPWRCEVERKVFDSRHDTRDTSGRSRRGDARSNARYSTVFPICVSVRSGWLCRCEVERKVFDRHHSRDGARRSQTCRCEVERKVFDRHLNHSDKQRSPNVHCYRAISRTRSPIGSATPARVDMRSTSPMARRAYASPTGFPAHAPERNRAAEPSHVPHTTKPRASTRAASRAVPARWRWAADAGAPQSDSPHVPIRVSRSPTANRTATGTP